MIISSTAMYTMNNQNNYTYHFDSNTCKTCGGKCCRGRAGYVWISIEELEKMAALWCFLNSLSLKPLVFELLLEPLAWHRQNQTAQCDGLFPSAHGHGGTFLVF